MIFCLENLNTAVDHPGTPFARAADTLALVAAVDNSHLRLMFDVSPHAQIGEGNLVELINTCAPYISGHFQVADVPGRCEPGTGEINYPRIAQALRDIGYRGTIGLEAWACVLATANVRWNASELPLHGTASVRRSFLIGRFRAIDQVPSADIRHWSGRPRQALRRWVLR